MWRADSVVFCAFDLLTVDGKPLINKPVEWRKALLAKLLTLARSRRVDSQRSQKQKR